MVTRSQVAPWKKHAGPDSSYAVITGQTLLTTGPKVPLTQLWKKPFPLSGFLLLSKPQAQQCCVFFWRKTRPCPQDSVMGAWPGQKTENMSSAFSSCCAQPGSISTAEDRNLYPQSHERLLRRPQPSRLPSVGSMVQARDSNPDWPCTDQAG